MVYDAGSSRCPPFLYLYIFVFMVDRVATDLTELPDLASEPLDDGLRRDWVFGGL